MNVIQFFARNARSKLLVAVIVGMISGLSSMVLLGLFAAMLRGTSQYSALGLACVLLALCLFLPLTRFISEAVLLRLAQGELFNLRMRLSRQILQAGLRHLETLGAEPLMTALTEDIPVIVDALHLIPPLCLNIAIVFSGFIYLGLLSWRILLLVLGFLVLGLLVYELPSRLS